MTRHFSIPLQRYGLGDCEGNPRVDYNEPQATGEWIKADDLLQLIEYIKEIPVGEHEHKGRKCLCSSCSSILGILEASIK